MRPFSVTCTASCALAVSLFATGCLERDIATLTPRVARGIDQPVSSEGIPDVDLLLVIDDSGSMEEEQALLEREIPRLVRGLTAPPDENGDGEPDWNAAESLRVAIVTTDLGTSGEPERRLGGCGLESPFGDPWGEDGALRADVACDPSASPVQEWHVGDDVDAFVDRVSCVASVGHAGCGFEQPLAAAVRALSRSDETSFPRDQSLLAVLVLSDEEDCSLGNPASFFAELPASARDTNAYCVGRTDALVAIDDLAHDLAAGRDESLFVFAAITGIPVDLVGQPFADVLADARMQYVPEPANATGLAWACTARNADATVRSEATPGRRYVELASRVPGAVVRSICEEDFRPAIEEITRHIGSRITRVCLGRALTPDADGRVDCAVTETLPLGTPCASVPGRVPTGVDADGREVCDVAQAPNAAGSGWYYNLADPACDQVSFTPDALPPYGARLRFQCLVEVPRDDRPVGP